ncbi:helix-turn-helix domain-containing protein [Crossiella sp. CA-258035]|uniref:winged helix-turn-helix transcriptional regulator n=1 Tax=Crossiella sp. CA-258035 TaxID=2981138 RepID=UPI0024BD0537|nr:helix-turn-helix domain-containing protein [Crossiella sp. CA-258035]WHT16783.1 helix-turn-helix domain-containing protein [Crossiella sp. CA-258035]
MRHKSFEEMTCAIAQTLNQVGEWWSLLLIRDALHGLTRFDEFQQSMGISPNSLTRRLSELCDRGLLERRRYQERPPRDEYVLTDRGRDLRPVIEALGAWGRRHVTGKKAAVRLRDDETGAEVDPVLVDRHTGRRLDGEGFHYAATRVAHPVKRSRLPKV